MAFVKMASAMCPEQCRAARGLLDWTQDQLAHEAGVSRSTVRDFECSRHTLQRTTEHQIITAFENAGVRFIDAGRAGPGVRLLSARPLPMRTEQPRPE